MARTCPVLLLVRHGQSLWNELDILGVKFPIAPDPPLTAQGKTEATKAGEVLAEYDIDLVLSSPLSRALQTADLALQSHPCRSNVPRIVLASLAEDLSTSGDIGRTPNMLYGEFPAHWDFNELPDHWWVGGHPAADTLSLLQSGVILETEEDFIQRVSQFTSWLQARPERTIAIFGHGDFFRYFSGKWLKNGQVFVCPLDQMRPILQPAAHR